MNRKRLCVLGLSFLLGPATASAELPWMKDLAGGRDLPRPWGLGIDFFTMDQDYNIDSLVLGIPGLSVDPSQLGVTNEIQHFDLKLDAWILPFMNVFAIIGHMDGETDVDLSQAEVVGLPFPLTTLTVDYDGTVYGGGFTLAAGGERWFTSVTTTYTETSLSGDFDSSVEALTVQPRIGILRGGWSFWVGTMYLDAEEKHSGVIQLPVLGAVPFDVELGSADDFNFATGARYVFSEHADISLELGFGDREHTLFNYTYRF
ncbi:MAG: hypothetical protein R3233_06485 [Xanthomonadales bacterium]|nr:hypothetical protein [Xanthomonadales bacterium]